MSSHRMLACEVPGCGDTYVVVEDTGSIAKMRTEAASVGGWGIISQPGGSTADLCPTCLTDILDPSPAPTDSDLSTPDNPEKDEADAPK